MRCVFLGTCSNQDIADKLVGIVKYVITVYEDIKSQDASDFTYEFYKRYKTALTLSQVLLRLSASCLIFEKVLT